MKTIKTFCDKHGITENIEAPEVSAFAPQKESSSNYEELVE